MKFVVCSVFDSGVGAFMTPFFVRSKGEGVRSFLDAVADEKLPFKRHPGDFTLMFLGFWDDGDGTFVLSDAGVCTPLITALECQVQLK